jgi:hypothetical protein
LADFNQLRLVNLRMVFNGGFLKFKVVLDNVNLIGTGSFEVFLFLVELVPQLLDQPGHRTVAVGHILKRGFKLIDSLT